MALKKYEGKLTGKEKIGITLENGQRVYITLSHLLGKKAEKPKKTGGKK